MLTWETLDLNATWPDERFHAVSRRRDYRIFDSPEAYTQPTVPWTLVVRDLGEDGIHTHVHLGNYRTDDEAKRAAEQWAAPEESRGGPINYSDAD
jgi:hypothetical protein